MFAAALAIPLLLLLYFLRLRRQRLRVPSTLLWEKSFEDLQANALFQRLRWSVLLILQLLLLLLLLLAVAQPMAGGDAPLTSRTVLLVDRSASMNAAVDAQRTRLDAAKDIGRELIDALGRGDSTRQMLIIAFGASPQVVSVYESNRTALLAALNSISPSDEQADLGAALDLAGAYAGAGESPDEQTPQVILLSDGCVHLPFERRSFSLRAGIFRFVQVVPEQADAAIDNIGIAAFSVRRDADDPAEVLAFTRALNAGSKPVDVVFTFWVNDRAAASIRRAIPAATDQGPGEDSFTQRLDVPEGATLTVRHNRVDQLPSDDAAIIVLPAPARPRMALVHPTDSSADPFLEDLIAAIEPERILTLTVDAWMSRSASESSQDRIDLVVFDRVSGLLPTIPSLTFGAVPAPLRMVDGSQQPRGQAIVSWDRQHSLMRNVALDTIVFTGFNAMEVGGAATTLASGQNGPVMVELRTGGARHVVVGFEFRKSNWPLHVSSAVFMQNVIEHLTQARLGETGLSFSAGESVMVRATADTTKIQISGPQTQTLDIEPGGSVTLPPLRRAGLYQIAGAAPPHELVAVNIASDSESDIRPRREIMVNSETPGAVQGESAMSRPLWPWLLGAALALLVAEWLMYCRRAAG